MLMSHLSVNLYKHQDSAFEKLKNVRVGALFMDMGTGKTLCALKLFEFRLNNGKVEKAVFLVPKSTEKNLIVEIQKHTSFKISKDIYIYGIDSIGMSDRIYKEVRDLVDDKTFLVIDESTYIKNHLAKRTKRAIDISQRCSYKLIMTGTPITKYVKDLYSQLTFLSPKILGYDSFYKFKENHLEYDVNTGKIYSSHNVEWLSKKISPYIYEVSIDDVVDLPDKIKKTYNYTLDNEIAEEYNNVKYEFLTSIDELPQNLLYSYLTKLQKVILYDENRVKVLLRVLNEIDDDKQVIIWCRFNQEIENIRNSIESYAIFNGSIKDDELFLNGNKRILLANLQTGSHGHNFQNCHYQIFFSNSFDYATRLQAERRIWRIGQQNKCVYVDIKSNAGIENMIFNCLSNKEDLLDKFLELSKKYNTKYIKEYLSKELDIVESI